MTKNKIKIFIDPMSDTSKKPVDIVLVSDAIDYVSSRFNIDSIDIQLNEHKRPSEFYFDFLSGLCKNSCRLIKIDNYTGKKKPNVFQLDSFSNPNLIIDNEKPFTLIFENEKRNFDSLDSLTDFLSQY